MGLWLGERGRRLTTERLLLSGSPSNPIAQRLPDRPDAEGRALVAGRGEAEHRFSEETIRRGVAQIKAEAESLGQPISEKEARVQAVAMLYGSLEADADLSDYPG